MASPNAARNARRRPSGLSLCSGALLMAAAVPANAAPDITGKWQTPEGALIDIRPCGGAPCGKIANFRPLPGHTVNTARDVNNKDAAKRSRRILGLTVLWGLKPKGRGWQGRVYDPRRGISANAAVTLDQPDRLTLRGCVRVLFTICETETWRRIR